MTTGLIINQDHLNPFLAKLKQQEPALILALGDSNMDNTHFTRGAKQWPELLHSEIKSHYTARGLFLLNSAVSGNTVLDALSRFDRDVRAYRPDLTLFCLGSNDADHLSDEAFEAGFTECLNRLEALGGVMVVFTPPPIMEIKPEPPHIWRQDLKRSRKVQTIRERVRGRNLAFVDLCQIMNDMEDRGELDMKSIMTDEVHLNAKGHQLVFRIFAPLFGLPPTFFWEREAEATASPNRDH